jgi:hypothetical protein
MTVDCAIHADVQTPWAKADDGSAPGGRGNLLHGFVPRRFRAISTYGRDDGSWKAINHGLVMEARDRLGRDAPPNAGIIDSQSVKTTQSGSPRGL